MEKRLVIAIALSIFIILAFQFLVAKPRLSQQMPVVDEASSTLPPKASEMTPPPESKQSFEEREIEVETDRYIIIFSNVGGSIKDIRLKEYKNLSSGEGLELVQIMNPHDYIFAISNPLGRDGLDMAEYSVSRTDGVIVYKTKVGSLDIEKRYILHNSKHAIELQLSIKNSSSAPIPLSYRIIGGSSLTEEKEQDKRMIEATAKVNDKIANFKRPRPDERIMKPGSAVWASLHNKYFSLILKPFIQTKAYFYSYNKEGLLVTGVESEEVTIQPGRTIDNKFLLYAGPSNIPVLKELGYGLEETINYGFFGGISKVLIAIMRVCYGVVRNWGFSIILLAIILNIILFPLSMKSFKSMQKMQELQPQMEKLKVQYKSNPQKLNQEIMELYKKYGINPLSGCLPLLLQMPIFFALYQALMKSIELRNASFLWVRDLSSPEAIPIPITLPIIGNSINILPLVMVAAMVLQQKLSTKSAATEEQKQQQKMMLIIMPIMFGFLFYNMPSGLVLYWLVSTVLTVAEQALVLKSV